MFYQYREKLEQVSVDEVSGDVLTVGYVTCGELFDCYEKLGFELANAEECRTANRSFRSGVEVHDAYTFTELRITDPDDEEAEDDCVALFVKKNLIVVVDVEDRDGSTKNKFFSVLNKFSSVSAVQEKIICSLLEQMISGNFGLIETMGEKLAKLEDDLAQGDVAKDYNFTLLHAKKRLMAMHNYYEQILDITEALDENENGILNEEKLFYISNIAGKVTRLREDADTLRSFVVQLQDTYSSYLDMQMNRTMKILTVITTVFFPLTIIVGWYGMNFRAMPELAWKYGYVYVIVLSAAVVCGFFFIGKKKKWY